MSGFIPAKIPSGFGYQSQTWSVTRSGCQKPNGAPDSGLVLALLVYVKRGSRWQLVAFEWVFSGQAGEEAAVPGATYGSFGAACHYQDGTFAPAEAEAD